MMAGAMPLKSIRPLSVGDAATTTQSRAGCQDFHRVHHRLEQAHHARQAFICGTYQTPDATVTCGLCCQTMPFLQHLQQCLSASGQTSWLCNTLPAFVNAPMPSTRYASRSQRARYAATRVEQQSEVVLLGLFQGTKYFTTTLFKYRRLGGGKINSKSHIPGCMFTVRPNLIVTGPSAPAKSSVLSEILTGPPCTANPAQYDCSGMTGPKFSWDMHC
jgi:hypothetical protein